MLGGLDEGTMPPEYTGGMTPKGVFNLYEFASEGGTLVAMDGASELPIEVFGLHVRNVTANQPESKFFIPGTILKIQVDNRNPVAWGMRCGRILFREPCVRGGPFDETRGAAD
jgi:hypothetical protein